MPVPAIGQVGGVSQNAVSAPGDDMRRSGHNIEGATGAQVRFDRVLGRHRLNVPQTVPSHLTATPPREQVIQVCGFVVVDLLPDFTASGSIAARHGFSLKREPDARHQDVADTSAGQVPADT